MPRIPRLDLNGRSRIAPVSAPRAAPGKFGSLGGTISELGDALLHIEDSVKKVATLHQVTKATLEANREIMKTQDEALLDPDLDTNLPRYQQRIRQIAEESVGRVTDPLARMELQGNLSTRLTALDFQLATEARKTLGRKALEVLDLSDEQSMEQIYRSPNEAMTQQEIVLHSQRVADAVAVGALSPIEGRKRIKEFSDNAREFSLTRQIEMDAEGALAVLQGGQHGIQNPKTVEQLSEKAKDKVAADVAAGKAMLSDLQDTNELDAFKALTEGKLTLSLLEKQEGRQEIRPKFRDALQANLMSTERAGAVTDPDKFLDLFKQATRTSKWAMAMKGGTIFGKSAAAKKLEREGQKPSADIETLMLNVINANTQGDLATADMQQLVGIIDADFQKAATAARHVWYNGILETVETVMARYTLPGLVSGAVVRVAMPLIRRMAQGELKEPDVDEAIRGALTHEARAQHPAMAMQESLPDAVMDQRGLSPTGTEPSKATAQYVFQNGKLVKVKAKPTATPTAAKE